MCGSPKDARFRMGERGSYAISCSDFLSATMMIVILRRDDQEVRNGSRSGGR